MEIKPKKTQDGVTIKDLAPGTPFRLSPGGNIYLRLDLIIPGEGVNVDQVLVSFLDSGETFYVPCVDIVLRVKGAFVEE